MPGFDEEFDFVVVGSGGGSMCAGLLMRSVGKSVLILEKKNLIGGTTSRSGGVMWIPNNRFMKRDGVEDSFENASAYLDAVVGDQPDAPGATRERRRKYLTEAPRMIDFLVSQGIKLTRVAEWPDYYDDRPGGSAQGRTVAELFDVNELGPWKQKLRPSFIVVPVMLMPNPLGKILESCGIDFLTANLPEMMALTGIRQSWRIKMLAVKIILRTVAARLSGKQFVAGGASLQGRMLQASVRAGVGIRTESPVSELIVDEGARGAGSSVGPSLTWGFVAAKHAAKIDR